MVYSFPSYAPAFLANSLLTALITVVAFRRRPAPGATVFSYAMALATFWSFTQYFESGSTTAAGSLFWTQIQYIATTMMPATWFLFAVRYCGLRFLEGRGAAVLFIIPAITLVLAWTNPLHSLIWTDVSAAPGQVPFVHYEHGLWLWFYAIYSYILVIAGSMLLVRESMYAPVMRRHQAIALVAGAMAPIVANAIYMLDLSPIPGLDLTPFAFTLSGLMYLPALYNLHVLDIAPVARGAIIDQMSDSVIVTDTQNRVVDANAAAANLSETGTGSWIGQRLEQALAAFPELARMGTGDQPEQAVLTIPATPERTLDVQKTPLTNRHGIPVGTLFLLRDITQFRLAEQRSFDLALEHERVRMLSRFIRDASHEFRTPLAVINTSLYLLERSANPDIQHAQCEKIAAQVSRINHLLNDMLTISRLDYGEPLTLIDVDLNALLSQVVDAAHGQSDTLPVIRLDLGEPLPAVRGDVAQLRRVVENLLTNAIDHTCPEGTITLSSATAGEFVVISLSDTGAGMDMDTQHHAFEHFFRSDDAHSTPGLGLGLPMTRAIVEAHGGTIEVMSAPGKGSTFTVQLPAQAPAPAPQQTAVPYRVTAPLRPGSEPIIERP